MSVLIAQIDLSKPEWWGALGGVAAAGAAALSCIVAVVYTIVTAWLLRETRRQRQALTEPHVIVYSTPDENAKQIIMLIVENIGKATAFDVKFQPDRPIPKSAYGIERLEGNPEVMTEGAFLTGIPALPPGGKRMYSWGQYGGLRDALGGRSLTIVSSFEHEGRRLTSKSVVEVESLLWTDASDRNAVSDCAESLKKLADSVRNVTTGSGMLRVHAVDFEAEKARMRQRFEEHKARQSQASAPQVNQ